MADESQFIGVSTGVDDDQGALKRALFLFDRLALVNTASVGLELRHSPQIVSDLRWLESEGYALDLKDPTGDWRARSRGLFAGPFQDVGRLQEGVVEFIDHLKSQRVRHRWGGSASSVADTNRLIALEEIEKRLIARIHTIELTSRPNMHAVLLPQQNAVGALGVPPLGEFAQVELERVPEHLRSVAQMLDDTREETTAAITLRAFPIPSDFTPLYDVTAFRREADSRLLFASLKDWMNRVARGDMPPQHIEDELRHLISSFERHMNLARMKYERSTVTLIAVASAEFLEELVRFRFSRAFDALGAFQREKVLLMEAEAAAPGSEVAYLLRAQRKFG
jgi:hypothetical protein